MGDHFEWLSYLPLGASVLWKCHAEDYYELSYNITHRTVSGIAAYRSALTLDWLADEDSRQRELAHVFETEVPMLPKELEHSECMAYSRPAPGKVARLMLELLKNIEGDDGVVQELTRTLIRIKLLIETSMLEAEPDLESLVHTPTLLQGEPHATLPRVLAVVWALATDPVATETSGWCAIKKLSQYLMVAPPTEIAARMRAIDPIISRARFIIEDFMQTVTPLYMRRETTTMDPMPKSRKHRNRARYLPTRSTLISDFLRTSYSNPTRTEHALLEHSRITIIPNAPPIPEPIQMKTDTSSVKGSVKGYTDAACVVSCWMRTYVCVVMCILMI